MKVIKGEIPDNYSYNLPNKVRHKVIGTLFDHSNLEDRENLNLNLERELGRSLSSEQLVDIKVQEFMFKCSDAEFLSSVELFISLKHLEYSNNKVKRKLNEFKEMIDNLKSFIDKTNAIFKIDKIGYEIVPAGLENLPFIIVPFNSNYLHIETIKKPMALLYKKEFEGPLNEFEKALEEYRLGKYSNAVIESNKSYESTLKTILDIKNVEYGDHDKIPNLVDKIRNDTDLIEPKLKSTFDSFWSVIKNGPPTIRNKPGIAHGQGKKIVDKTSKTYADFVLRLTGTFIAFLIKDV